jgi:hypothetical protein
VSVVVVTPVPVFVAVMVTPGISAPAGSDTLPPKLPFCENPKLAISKPNKTAPKTFLHMRAAPFLSVAEFWWHVISMKERSQKEISKRGKRRSW